MKVYTEDRSAELKRRIRISEYISVSAASVSFGLCILLCILTNTLNAAAMTAAAIGISTLGGWTFILTRHLVFNPSKAEYEHINGLMSCDRERICGTLLSVGQRFRIPKSIEVVKVRVQTDNDTVILNLISRAACLLPEAGSRVYLIISRGYITEVQHEKA